MIKGGNSNKLTEVNSLKEKVISWISKANIFFANANYSQAIDLYSECLEKL